MPCEAFLTHAMKETAVTRGEFDLTGNEVGKRITKKAQELVQRRGSCRVEFRFKVLIYRSEAWHELKFRMKLGHKLNYKTS